MSICNYVKNMPLRMMAKSISSLEMNNSKCKAGRKNGFQIWNQHDEQYFWQMHLALKHLYSVNLVFGLLNSFTVFKTHHCILPNQELSGAKSELPGGTVGVCSFYRRCGQLPYNLPITHLRFAPRSLQACLLAHFNKWSIFE